MYPVYDSGTTQTPLGTPLSDPRSARQLYALLDGAALRLGIFQDGQETDDLTFRVPETTALTAQPLPTLAGIAATDIASLAVEDREAAVRGQLPVGKPIEVSPEVVEVLPTIVETPAEIVPESAVSELVTP